MLGRWHRDNGTRSARQAASDACGCPSPGPGACSQQALPLLSSVLVPTKSRSHNRRHLREGQSPGSGWGEGAGSQAAGGVRGWHSPAWELWSGSGWGCPMHRGRGHQCGSGLGRMRRPRLDGGRRPSVDVAFGMGSQQGALGGVRGTRLTSGAQAEPCADAGPRLRQQAGSRVMLCSGGGKGQPKGQTSSCLCQQLSGHRCAIGSPPACEP